MARHDRDEIVAALLDDVGAVARALGIELVWRGRWARSRRCARADHVSEAFAISREGKWHCHACNEGGDVLTLIAADAGLDARRDFGAVLERAAELLGRPRASIAIDFDDAAPPRRAPRPPPPPPLSHEQRYQIATSRARWLWDRLCPATRGVELYLESRGIDRAVTAALIERDEIRAAPVAITPEELARAAERGVLEDVKSVRASFSEPGVALPVRDARTGALVDVRIRRFEPREGRPKLVGMLGGYVTAGEEAARPRTLIGCYGHPERVDADLAVIVEGALDTLSAIALWPDACVVGAVDSGQIPLVARHVAAALAARGGDVRLRIVVQNDPPNSRTGRRPGPEAADVAAREALLVLGPRAIEWCTVDEIDGAKDLNDALRAGRAPHIGTLWRDVAEEAP